MPTMQKMIESDPSKAENISRKTTIPHPISLILENFATPSGPATANIVATSKSQEERLGPSCQCCTQSALTPRTSRLQLVRGGLGWRNTEGKTKRAKKRRTKTKIGRTWGNCSLLSPQPAYEEDPPTLRDLPPKPNQEGHSDCNRMEEEKRKVLELLGV